MIETNSTEPMENFTTGAKRAKPETERAWHLLSPIALRAVAEVYAYGAGRYGKYNWEKGIPASNLMDHALEHIFAWLAGESSEEDHLAHAAWGLLALLHMREAHPELMDCERERGVTTLPVE
jgi:hypothetical protein